MRFALVLVALVLLVLPCEQVHAEPREDPPKVAATPGAWSAAPAVLWLSVERWHAAEPPKVAVKTTRQPRSKRSGGGGWDGVAACESGGDWSINTGNGYYGGLQMDMTFWQQYGARVPVTHEDGSVIMELVAPRPDLASRDQQIAAADRAAVTRGRSPWPVCGSR